MSSRNRFGRLALLVAGSLSLSGCWLHFNEAPIARATLQVKAPDTGCMTGGQEALSRYVDGKDTGEMDRIFQCATTALDAFNRKTRGKDENQYTADELRTFMEQDLGIALRPGLFDEVKKLKSALIGGSPDVLTRTELQRVRAFVIVLQNEFRHLHPFLPLTTAHPASRNEALNDLSVKALVSAAEALGRFIQQSGGSYSFSDLDAFLATLSGTEQLRARIPSLQALKPILIGSVHRGISGDRIDNSEWFALLSVGAGVYGEALRWSSFFRVHDHDWYFGEGRARLMVLSEGMKDLLDRAIAFHPAHGISITELQTLVDSLTMSDLFSREDLDDFRVLTESERAMKLCKRKAAIKGFIPPLITRLLGGSNADSEGRLAEGLTHSALERIDKSLRHWSDGQIYLEALFQKTAYRISGSLPADFPALAFSPKVLLLSSLSLESSEVGREMQKVICRPRNERAFRDDLENGPERIECTARAIHRGTDGLVSIDPSLGDQNQLFFGLSQMSWMREMVNLLLTGYTEDPKRTAAGGGVTMAEFKHFTDDIREIGIEYRFVDSRKYDMHFKRFREANLFTFVSNGDAFIDLEEGTNLLAFLLSAEKTARKIHKDIAAVCTNYGLDPFRYEFIDAKCYRQHFFGDAKRYWDHLPGLVRYYDSLDPVGRKRFQVALEQASRTLSYTERPIDIVDSEGFTLVSLYVETLFARYGDSEGAGILTALEAHDAFPIFKETISQLLPSLITDPGLLARLSTDQGLESIFTYLLAHGEKPDGESWTGKLKFWWWMKRPSNFVADRSRILKIFGELGRVGTVSPPPENESNPSSDSGPNVSGPVGPVLPGQMACERSR